MKHGYRFQIGWVRASDGAPVRGRWLVILPLLAIIALLMFIIPHSSAAPAPAAHVQPAATATPSPSAPAVTTVQIPPAMSGDAVCVLPTGKAAPRKIALVVKEP